MHIYFKRHWSGLAKTLIVITGLTVMIPGDAMAKDLFGRLKSAVSQSTKNVTQNVAQKSGDHPLIVPYQGSVLEKQDRQDYTEYNRVIGMDKSRRAVSQRLEGKLTQLLYANPKGRSTLEMMRNYKSALQARGFRIDYDHSGGEGWITGLRKYNGMIVYGNDVRYFTGKMKYNEGTAYVSILVYREGSGFGRTNIHVVETSQMDADMVDVDPSAAAAERERN